MQDERPLKVSGGRKDEELNAKCRDDVVHVVFLCISTFSVACEGQIMSFVINIASGCVTASVFKVNMCVTKYLVMH